MEVLRRGSHLIMRREVGSPTTLKCSLSNAAPDTPTLRLAQMQGHRYWVERIFDAKGKPKESAALAMIRRSAGRQHMVMLHAVHCRARRPRKVHLDLLSPRDIVDMLNETLPRKPEGNEALMRRINERYAAAERHPIPLPRRSKITAAIPITRVTLRH
jgi:hypothetical protein